MASPAASICRLSSATLQPVLLTPITAIVGYSEMLLEDAGDQGQEDFIPDLQKICDAAQHFLLLLVAIWSTAPPMDSHPSASCIRFPVLQAGDCYGGCDRARQTLPGAGAVGIKGFEGRVS